MNIITIDLETYYNSKTYTLKKFTTEEYVRHPDFQVIGVGIKVNDGPTIWVSGTHEELHKHLLTYNWRNARLLCHNTLFDGAILKWRFNISPAMYLDTLCMARALHGVDAGGSLASLSQLYKIGEKGTEVLDAKGAHRADFTPEGLAQYGEYCKNDVELTRKLFDIFAPQFPVSELKLIDITLRMFTQPVLELDDVMLTERLDELQDEKLTLLGSLKQTLNVETEEEVRKKLASNKQFAQVLTDLGVQPPMKLSKTTGKETFALAKNDEGFIALTEHENPVIQELCAVRLGTKSTIEESRIERFLDVGKRNKGRLPIPLKYYGAHTGRWAGSDKVNFQNLPSRDKKKKALKNAVVAPEGYVVVNCDSSQIEARTLAWLAEQDDLVEAFDRGVLDGAVHPLDLPIIRHDGLRFPRVPLIFGSALWWPIRDTGHREHASAGRPTLERWAASPSRYLAAPAARPDALRARIRRCRVARQLPCSTHEEASSCGS